MKRKQEESSKIYLILFAIIMLFIGMFTLNYLVSNDPELAKITNEALTPWGLGNKDLIFAESCKELNATLEGDTCYLNKNESKRYRFFMNCDGRSIIFDYDFDTDVSLPKKYRDKCTIGKEERTFA